MKRHLDGLSTYAKSTYQESVISSPERYHGIGGNQSRSDSQSATTISRDLRVANKPGHHSARSASVHLGATFVPGELDGYHMPAPPASPVPQR
jgi:hypothetical protein